MSKTAVFLWPKIIYNKKKVLHIDPGTRWSLKGEDYYPEGIDGTISVILAWNSNNFHPLMEMKKLDLVPSIIDISEDGNLYYKNENEYKKIDFIPNEGDMIWSVAINGELINSKYIGLLHRPLLEFGNVFPDSKSALKASIKIKELLR